MDRARGVAPSRVAKPISPQALLWGLLPRPASLRERLTWGEPDDPLTRVWKNVDVALIMRGLSITLGRKNSHARLSESTKARFDWRWIVPGGLWAAFHVNGFLQSKSDVWVLMFCAGFTLVSFVDLWGRLQNSASLRSKAVSFIAGGLAVVTVSVFLSVIFGI